MNFKTKNLVSKVMKYNNALQVSKSKTKKET